MLAHPEALSRSVVRVWLYLRGRELGLLGAVLARMFFKYLQLELPHLKLKICPLSTSVVSYKFWYAMFLKFISVCPPISL